MRLLLQVVERSLNASRSGGRRELGVVLSLSSTLDEHASVTLCICARSIVMSLKGVLNASILRLKVQHAVHRDHFASADSSSAVDLTTKCVSSAAVDRNGEDGTLLLRARTFSGEQAAGEAVVIAMIKQSLRWPTP